MARQTRRYYVLAAHADHPVVALFKLEQGRQSDVVVTSLAEALVATKDMHVTLHPPKSGRDTRIIHGSDSRGTDVRIPLDPSAETVYLGACVLDLSDFPWTKAKPFAKTGFDEKWTVDVDRDGAIVNAHFYRGSPERLTRRLDALIASRQVPVWLPKPHGFGPPPAGYPGNFARFIFDGEAEVTLGCILVTFDRPSGTSLKDYLVAKQVGETIDEFLWVAYGSGGEVARGEMK